MLPDLHTGFSRGRSDLSLNAFLKIALLKLCISVFIKKTNKKTNKQKKQLSCSDSTRILALIYLELHFVAGKYWVDPINKPLISHSESLCWLEGIGEISLKVYPTLVSSFCFVIVLPIFSLTLPEFHCYTLSSD